MTSVDQTIEEIVKGLSPRAKVWRRGTAGYKRITTDYYWLSSEECPVIVIQPWTTKDVAVILQAIAWGDESVTFAVRGGGHIAPPGFNSTYGILVDMGLFNQVRYDDRTTLVNIGPGLYWEEVYGILNKVYRNVHGATTCKNVGVAGFNLGGGYSNKTNQLGLAIDTIVAITVVLPTGEIKTVDANNDPDLFWCLRGGGNNFGIVTNWTMKTQPLVERSYSHFMQYGEKYFPELVDAVMAFTKKEVPKSNVELFFEYTYLNDKLTVAATAECFYDGPKDSIPPDLFKDFEDIKHIDIITTETWMDRQRNLPRNRQTYSGGFPSGKDDLPPFRGRFSCVMVNHFTKNLVREAIRLAQFWSTKMAENKGLHIYPDIWPFLPSTFCHSPSTAWPHTGSMNGPLVINFKWEDECNDDFWINAIENMTRDLRNEALKQGCTTKEAPVYYNLALENVHPREIYRDNYFKLRALRQKYDPQNVMDRTGGFRIH